MRVLEFSVPTIFELFYEGLITSNKTSGNNTRTLGKVLSKLEAVGVVKEVVGLTELYTLSSAAIVELEDSEYELAKVLSNTVEWNGRSVVKAGKMLEFIESAPTKEQYEARKVGVIKLEESREPSIHN